MMKKPVIEISRDQLYKEVWEIPIQRLAKQYNISDRGLTKVCKKMNIPTPPRGYWAKIQNGQRINTTPLPKLKTNGISTYRINGRYPEKQEEPVGELDVEADALALIRELRKPENQIVVPKQLIKPHPLVQKTMDELWGKTPDKDGYARVCPHDFTCLAVDVAPESLRRALLIMNVIIKRIEKMGCSIIGDRYLDQHSTVLEVFGKKVPLILREVTHRPSKLDPNEYGEVLNGKFHQFKGYGYEPTGKLTLRIRSYFPEGRRVSWSDGIRNKLEDKLNDVLIGIIIFADSERKRALEWEKWKQEFAETQRIQEEAKQAKKIEQGYFQKLKRDARNLQKSYQLNELIQHAEMKAKHGMLTIEEKVRFDDWLKWAKSKTLHLDPFRNGIPSFIDSYSSTLKVDEDA